MTISIVPRTLRRRRFMITAPATGKNTAYKGRERQGDAGVMAAVVLAVVVMVNVVVTGDEPGVTDCGEKLHTAPVGSPAVQANCTSPVNPPAAGVMVMVQLAGSPAATVFVGLAGVGTEKSCMVTLRTAEVLVAKLASPL